MALMYSLAQALVPSVSEPARAQDLWTLINVLLSAMGVSLAAMGAFIRWQVVKWNERADMELSMRQSESKARMAEDARRTECLESLVDVSTKLAATVQQQDERGRKIWRHAATAIENMTNGSTPDKVRDSLHSIRTICGE